MVRKDCNKVSSFQEIADGGNYILTGERDEKIRVSHYPDTYDIVSYCLGHKTFVSSLTVIPGSSWLISGSEGGIILWDYKTGTKKQEIELEVRLIWYSTT